MKELRTWLTLSLIFIVIVTEAPLASVAASGVVAWGWNGGGQMVYLNGVWDQCKTKSLFRSRAVWSGTRPRCPILLPVCYFLSQFLLTRMKGRCSSGRTAGSGTTEQRWAR